jgi:hypothetical protein
MNPVKAGAFEVGGFDGGILTGSASLGGRLRGGQNLSVSRIHPGKVNRPRGYSGQKILHQFLAYAAEISL